MRYGRNFPLPPTPTDREIGEEGDYCNFLLLFLLPIHFTVWGKIKSLKKRTNKRGTIKVKHAYVHREGGGTLNIIWCMSMFHEPTIRFIKSYRNPVLKYTGSRQGFMKFILRSQIAIQCYYAISLDLSRGSNKIWLLYTYYSRQKYWLSLVRKR